MKAFLLLAILALVGVGPAGAADTDERFRHDDPRRAVREELFRPEERQFYRQRLWELKTEAERERFRDEQRQMLEERARALRLPPVRGSETPTAQEAETTPKWPDDGLRRWPREADDGLRRWNGRESVTARETEREALSTRHWPGVPDEEE